jgi:competence protein ComEC
MKKYFILSIIALGGLLGLFAFQYIKFNDGKLHIVFCDVGQGDAILIRTPSQKYILVDAGPDKKVLDCLSRHMPMWQRDIDVAILTHPHADHFMGFHFVKDRYHIKLFATEKLLNKTPAFELLMQKLTKEKIAQRFLLAGDKWQMGDGVEIVVAGPTQAFLDSTSPGGTIGESKEFASIVTLISFGNFSALLTGDSQAIGLEQSYEEIGKPVTILQSPHHGSATGLTAELLEKFNPKTAVISVGKNNYGHPNLSTLYLLKDIPIKRTDKDGDVAFVRDGN